MGEVSIAGLSSGACCVCGERDSRALIDVTLLGGTRVTLCGSHALMHRRSKLDVRTEGDLKQLLVDRRARWDRRHDGDELGNALVAAFCSDRRASERRREGV